MTTPACDHGADALDFDGNCGICDVESQLHTNESLTKKGKEAIAKAVKEQNAEMAAKIGDALQTVRAMDAILVKAEPDGSMPKLTISPAELPPTQHAYQFEEEKVGKEVMAVADTLGKQAAALTIRTEADYQVAGNQLKDIKAQKKAFEEQRKAMTRPLDEAKARILELFRPAELRLSQAELALKSATLRYLKERADQKQAEEQRLAALAEEERARLRAAGREDEAEMVATPVLVEPKSSVAGISTRETWHAEVTDFDALVQAVADKKVPAIALKPDMTVLNGQARSLKGAWGWPGVKAVKEEGVVART